MAAIFILAGGVFGFLSAMASLVLLDASLLLALAIWSGAGLAVVILGLGMAALVGQAGTAQAKSLGADAHSA
ncbi:hypothetical protein [Pseudotabrizicola algicola]|uniref:Uncharacterized protein n=1 Tax=Pseudotabrizicola algicola TaxID=2709381 RepID=A0A6B3RNL5_9RHOB|nr:hypothetical protein [Pseudotabrizicola algicola]NEX47687.1 hypothetical protein [Pseudotabrizicola algicola]